MKETNSVAIEKIFTENISDEDIIHFLENGDVDVYQRDGSRVWSFNYYRPSGAEYYLEGEYHSFDIVELEEYENKEDIYCCLKLYQEEIGRDEVLKKVKDIIENEKTLYKVTEFIYGLNHFLESNAKIGIYILS